MDEKLKTVCDALAVRYGAQVEEFRGEARLILKPEQLVAAASALRDEFGFEMLVDITAVDYWPENEPRFHLVYQLNSISKNLQLQLRLPVNGGDAHAPTLQGVYPAANWKEREIWDMFGVRFEGHPDLRRILMPHDWQGHPMRKDFPLGYEEVQFTFNFDEIDGKKPYAKE